MHNWVGSNTEYLSTCSLSISFCSVLLRMAQLLLGFIVDFLYMWLYLLDGYIYKLMQTLIMKEHVESCDFQWAISEIQFPEYKQRSHPKCDVQLSFTIFMAPGYDVYHFRWSGKLKYAYLSRGVNVLNRKCEMIRIISQKCTKMVKLSYTL